MSVLGVFVWPLLMAAALVVTGVLLAPRAGEARGRMWTGLAILIAVQVLSPIWQLLWVQIIEATTGPGRIATIGAMQMGYSILAGLLTLAGIVVLATAVTMGRDRTFGYAAPPVPGAPPSPAGGSPYLTDPNRPAPPR